MSKFIPFFLLSASLLVADPAVGISSPMREITPDAGPRVLGGWDMFWTADFIYWTPRVDGLAASLGTASGGGGEGSVYNPHWKWSPGFKVGLGSNLARDGWDTSVDFTWIESQAKRSARVDGLLPMWNIANQYTAPTPGLIYASALSWNWWMNTFDMELGRNFFVSPYLKLRPFMGLKTAFGIQKYAVQYTRTVSADVEVKDTMTNNFHYFGVGPRAGANAAWQFSEEWSLYSDASASLLWSDFRGTRKDTSQQIPFSENSSVTSLKTKNQFNTCKPVFEISLGLRWEIWFSDDDYHFLMQGGWEEQIWPSYNQVLRTTEQGAHGDLITQGMTLHFRFDF